MTRHLTPEDLDGKLLHHHEYCAQSCSNSYPTSKSVSDHKVSRHVKKNRRFIDFYPQELKSTHDGLIGENSIFFKSNHRKQKWRATA